MCKKYVSEERENAYAIIQKSGCTGKGYCECQVKFSVSNKVLFYPELQSGAWHCVITAAQ